MPSSAISSARPMHRNRIAFDPETGKTIPYSPFPRSRLEKVYHISKVRHINPFLINKGHFAST
jgi:hypothetical protein